MPSRVHRLLVAIEPGIFAIANLGIWGFGDLEIWGKAHDFVVQLGKFNQKENSSN
ncbi:hypothetical protein [Xenococcus sp. PCC 7305]|uniref:hypothetical protein n=1 Tax=Xenococcus sp. PCC 7305 TaxID=102125 RepID=UPI00130D8E2E|nr:hypothetical protein [Xenococcus sp. PCC 7305]